MPGGKLPGETSLSKDDWDTLLESINDRECTPILGAGINYGHLPTGAAIAEDWAKKHAFPLICDTDLPRVAQYLSITKKEKVFPKKQVRKLIREKKPPDFAKVPSHPLSILAALPFHVYITTNYDDYMFRALRSKGKDPIVELCGWNSEVRGQEGVIYQEHTVKPKDIGPPHLPGAVENISERKPLIYHLHGHYEFIQSIVLTENDYFDFLVGLSENQDLLPARIKKALGQAALLFIGYSLSDFDFRVIFRRLIRHGAGPELSRQKISIQMPPADIREGKRKEAIKYLGRYFEDMDISMFYCSAEEFTRQLEKQWKKYDSGSNAHHVIG